MTDVAHAVSGEPDFTAPGLIPLTEAEQVAAIIAQTSTDLAGRPESAVQAALVERFNSVALDISEAEARRIAHDISVAPRLRDIIDD